MAKIYPVTFKWQQVEIVDPDGVSVRRKAMVPLARYGNVADRQFHDDEEYTLVPLEARSRASHNAYFAAIHEGFQNLPEKIAARWPTEEHLRAWLLVETGWCDEMDVELASEDEARKLVRRTRSESPYARIHHNGRRVLVRYPKSQSAAAMSKQAFEDSKRDVLELLEHLIDVPKDSLKKEAGKSA